MKASASIGGANGPPRTPRCSRCPVVRLHPLVEQREQPRRSRSNAAVPSRSGGKSSLASVPNSTAPSRSPLVALLGEQELQRALARRIVGSVSAIEPESSMIASTVFAARQWSICTSSSAPGWAPRSRSDPALSPTDRSLRIPRRRRVAPARRVLRPDRHVRPPVAVHVSRGRRRTGLPRPLPPDPRRIPRSRAALYPPFRLRHRRRRETPRRASLRSNATRTARRSAVASPVAVDITGGRQAGAHFVARRAALDHVPLIRGEVREIHVRAAGPAESTKTPPTAPAR